MPEVTGERGLALSRAAGCMLRTLSATTVTLRYASRVTLGDARQLGLMAPAWEDVVVGPALVKNLEPEEGVRASDVLLGADTIAQEMERRGVGSTDELFAGLIGVVRNDVVWRLTSVAPMEFAGMEYLYRLKVAE